MNIRRATAADVEAIARIWCEGFESSFGASIPSVTSPSDFFRSRVETEVEPFGYWVAEVEGAVVGWQSLLTCRPGPVSRWAYSSTYISSANRSKGIGRALLGYVTSYAKHAGLTHIEGFVRIGNAPVIQIIESLGWQKVGVVPTAEQMPPCEAIYVYAV